MAEVGKIAFGPIPPPNPEPSLLVDKFRVFVDDMFMRDTCVHSHFDFLFQEFFPRLWFARLRMSFKKLQLFMSELSALGQGFRLGGEVRILPERVDKIIRWPASCTKTRLRGFLGAIQICRRFIKNVTEITRPLPRLSGTLIEWRWGLVEETSFRILRNKCATAVSMFGISWDQAVHYYFDASNFVGGFCRTQIQQNIERPIIFDSISFNQTQRKYGTIKKALLAIVHFSEKYKHYPTSDHQATFFTDHLPIVSFLNMDRHEGIYTRWAIKLPELNFHFAHIEGKRNVVADALSRTIFSGDDLRMDKELFQVVKKQD